MSAYSNLGIKNVKLIHRWANILGLVPPYGNLTEEQKRKHKFKGIFIAVSVILIFVSSMHVRKTFYVKSKYIKPLKIMIDTSKTLAMVGSILLAIGKSWNTTSVEKLCSMLNEIDKFFTKNSTKQKNSSNFYKKFLFLNVCVIILSVNEAIWWIRKEGFLIEASFVLKYIEYYYNFVMCAFVHTYVNRIHFYFVQLNRGLMSSVPYENIPIQIKSMKLFNESNLFKLSYFFNDYRKVRSHLQELINLFNDIFGWQLLNFYLSIFIGFMKIGYIVVASYYPSGDVSNILEFSWFTVLLFEGVLLIVVCSKATCEAGGTAMICYKLLLHTPAVSNSFQDTVRQELKLLAKQAQQNIKFSAAGFFTLNYTLVLGMITTVTPYFIIILQNND